VKDTSENHKNLKSEAFEDQKEVHLYAEAGRNQPIDLKR
jgi:hypothetical protein